jgi:hypothetical protein
MKVVSEAMLSDPEYAWSWHCNIAMAAFDEGLDHFRANKAAARFLALLVPGLDTSKHRGFPASPEPAAASQEPKCPVKLTIAESKKWRIVPIEPTMGMLIAGNHCQAGDYSAKLVWEKMIEAAERSSELFDSPLWQDCVPASQEQAQQPTDAPGPSRQCSECSITHDLGACEQPAQAEAGALMRGASIKATLYHGAGAYAQCGYCQRYSDDPKTLSDRQPACDCGEKHGWCGSFKPPTAEATWSNHNRAALANKEGKA